VWVNPRRDGARDAAGVPGADGVHGRHGRADGCPAGEHDPRRGGASGGSELRTAFPAQPPHRPLRRPDDGEPLVRPLLRLGGGGGRHPEPELHRSDGAVGSHAPLLHARKRRDGVQGLRPPGPGHGWESGRAQLLGGFLADGSGNDEFALTYFNGGELGFIHDAARTYTLYDRFFCSLLASTWPNRYYKWSAQSGGLKNNDPPAGTLGNQWETIFDRGLAHGLSARYYASDLPFSAVWGPRGATWTNPITRFYSDCAAGTLPNIAFVDPPFRDGGGGDGLSADEHPLGDVRLGQAFMADVVNAFVKSPNYRRGALFVLYDEWGGFFDHVTPPHVADDRASADLYEDFGQMGFRTPALAVSPYARGRKTRSGFRVDHGLYGHESVLKLISYRFGLGDLTLRQAQARNIGLSFDWEHADFDVPALPDPPEVATAPCALGGGDVLDSQAAHAGDLVALEQLAERFGVPTYEGKLGDIFTLPDTIQRAVTAGT
jgi:phospholipase C